VAPGGRPEILDQEGRPMAKMYSIVSAVALVVASALLGSGTAWP
jgi:hypothetical protein